MLQGPQKNLPLMYRSLSILCSTMPKGTMLDKTQNCKIHKLLPIHHNVLGRLPLMKKKTPRYKALIHLDKLSAPLKSANFLWKPFSGKLRII